MSSAKIDFEGSYDDLLDSMSHKTEDVILFLEDKLSELKAKNAKLQNRFFINCNQLKYGF
jgi:hypothetical protein